MSSVGTVACTFKKNDHFTIGLHDISGDKFPLQVLWCEATTLNVVSRGPFNSSPTGQMATISQTIFSDALFVNEMFFILIKFSLKFVPKHPIDNNLALV